jgi:hypothetical protein
MKVTSLTSLSLLSLLLALSAQASVDWTSAPLLKMERVKGGDRRSQSKFRPVNLTTEQIVEFPPAKGESTPNPLDAVGDGSYQINTRGVGNYHWLKAQAVDAQRFASTVKYFSNPGPSPRRMLAQDKTRLEIRPIDLPREHNRYHANESWDFQVMLDGKPVANTTVIMDTSKGSKLQATTNEQGIANLTFPDDFNKNPDPHAHHRGGHGGHRRPSAEFAVWTEHQGMTSAFNYSYSPDVFTNKAVLPAIGLVFAGSLITGFGLFRKRSAS